MHCAPFSRWSSRSESLTNGCRIDGSSCADRFVLENSGVAEPQNIRDQFSEAIAAGNPLMQRIYLDTLVTIVDSGTFIVDYSSRSPLAARPDLGEGGNLRPVVDLLVEQIE